MASLPGVGMRGRQRGDEAARHPTVEDPARRRDPV